MPRPSISLARKKNVPSAARVPSIGREEFKRRRRVLLKQMGRDSIAIVPTGPVRLRNNDVEYAYRPDSDFFYLTGFVEPESVAVLVPGRPQGEYILFVRDRDPARETWDGRRAGPDGTAGAQGAAVPSPSPPMSCPGSTRALAGTSLPLPPGVSPPTSGWRMIDGAYFESMRIPIVAGRTFTEHDSQESADVAIVNDIFARRFVGSPDAAIGRVVRAGVA